MEKYSNNEESSKDLRKILKETDTIISDRSYNIVFGLTLFWGFLINAFIVRYFTEFFLEMNPILLIVGYFILALLGAFINKKSDNAAISFLGYNLLVIPIGAVLSVVLVEYDMISIINALTITGIVVAVMMTLSMINPKIFLNIGSTLGISLLIVIIVECIAIIFFGTSSTIIDVIVVLIFCGFIGFDWARAQEYQKTINNAVDSAFDIYLDIINVFLRILRIMSKVKK